MLYSGYMEQFERLGRWLKRIEDQEVATVNHVDFMWAFFQNCYAMKEWIKNDDALPDKIKKSIENEIKEYPNILICNDLGNRSKHLTLGYPKGGDAKVSGIGVTIMVPLIGSSESCKTKHHYKVVGKDGPLGDGLEIAKKAYAEWESIIKDIQKNGT